MTKRITVQGKVDGVLVFDHTIAGKKHKRDLIRKAMQTMNANGVIRFQVVGAKNWALFAYDKKAGEAVQGFADDLKW